MFLYPDAIVKHYRCTADKCPAIDRVQPTGNRQGACRVNPEDRNWIADDRYGKTNPGLIDNVKASGTVSTALEIVRPAEVAETAPTTLVPVTVTVMEWVISPETVVGGAL